LAVRKIPLKERQYLVDDAASSSQPDTEGTPDDRPEDTAVQDTLTRIRAVVLQDRDIYDKAVKAYVSFIRAYTKHEASYIFRIKDLNLVGVARSFGLLRLPRCPELKGVDKEAMGWTDVDVEWKGYAYKDKKQEAKRVQELAAKGTEEAKAERAQQRKERAQKKKQNDAWSSKTVQREERDRRREKKVKKKAWMKEQVAKEAKAESVTFDEGDEADDWEELKREDRMAKKAKRTAIDM